MNFQEAIKYGFKNYANFSGVVGRPAYWNWILFIAVINIPATLGSVLVSGSSEGGLFQLLEVANLALLTPTLALSVRRLRDAGFSPLWLLSFLVAIPVAFIGASLSVNSHLTEATEMGIGVPFYAMFVGLIEWFAWFSRGLALAGILLLVLTAFPTKNRASGNRYAPQ